MLIRHWLVYNYVNPSLLSAHLSQFTSLGGYSRKIRSRIHIIWLACVGVISKETNKRCFSQKVEMAT